MGDKSFLIWIPRRSRLPSLKLCVCIFFPYCCHFLFTRPLPMYKHIPLRTYYHWWVWWQSYSGGYDEVNFEVYVFCWKKRGRNIPLDYFFSKKILYFLTNSFLDFWKIAYIKINAFPKIFIHTHTHTWTQWFWKDRIILKYFIFIYLNLPYCFWRVTIDGSGFG